MIAKSSKVTAIGPEVTNGGKETVEMSQPYVVTVKLEGVADLLFHRWNCEAVETKANAAKGSKAKKSDDVESYVYRNDDKILCLPGEYVRQSIIHAAKFRQDPRSPRKSACDLYKAAVVALTVLAPIYRATGQGEAKLGEASRDQARHGEPVRDWDYEHKCRVTIQRNGITRTRPAMKAGWECSLQLLVNLPEYVKPNDLHDVLSNAGRLVGVGDFRPTYGRFLVKSFDIGLE